MTSSSCKSGSRDSWVFTRGTKDNYQRESGVLDLEDQLNDALDNLTAKSAKTRSVAFEFLRKSLTETYQLEYVFNKKITILDTLSRCIKRSKSQDLGQSAALISAMCITIGQSPETDPLFSELVSQLLVLLNDQTVQAEVRAKCARTICICAFTIGVDGYVEEVMGRFHSIFSASFAKGDGSMPNLPEPIATLHSVCLQCWTILMTAVNTTTPHVAVDIVENYIDKITELLDSPSLEIRISAGEALAIMCEIIKSQNEDITADDFDDLCDKLREVMTDTQKSRGRKDNRQQKFNFREILSSIENGEAPRLIVKFGKERLVLETWSRRKQYDIFCDLLGAGLNYHLAENEVIRDIFDLGPVLIHMDMPETKRSDNSYENMVADRVRTKNLRRLRDKRADVIE